MPLANKLQCCPALDGLRSLPDKSVDLILTSPPYEDARLYGPLNFRLRGEDWVRFCVHHWLECDRVCRGMVAWVVAGKTRNYRWSATPSLLEAALHNLGLNLRDPRVFHRVGIPGSGGPDDWRHDHERIIVTTPPGRLPWSDPTACGQPPKYAPGGRMSYRSKDGTRQTSLPRNKGKSYVPPKLANPGNVIHLPAGGGHLGSEYAHLNEAPFPESLVEKFILCFCPPKGIVLDPFCGSGTTCAVAQRLGRKYIGFDARQSQITLTQRRLTHDSRKT